MLKILLQSRINLFSKPGGDTTHIVNLQESLSSKGLQVDISTELKPNLEGYDIVHLFNLTRVHETHIQMLNAKLQGRPVVCSPIYHDIREYNRKGRHGLGKIAFSLIRNDILFEYARGLFNATRDSRQIIPVFKQIQTGYRQQQAEVLKHADKIIFWSETEQNHILSSFNGIADHINSVVIHTGVWSNFDNTDAALFKIKYGLEDFILCVARVEDYKNQLGLLRALHDVPIPLVLIGQLNPAHRYYCKKVLAEVKKNGNAYYLGQMDKEHLKSAYAAAKVHVLPSWFETVGLTSLEAGLAGCNVVSTDRGYARDYLGDHAWYCDPSDQTSIRSAVEQALYSPKNGGLKKHIEKNFHVDKTIENLMNLYYSLAKPRRKN